LTKKPKKKSILGARCLDSGEKYRLNSVIPSKGLFYEVFMVKGPLFLNSLTLFKRYREVVRLI